MNATPIPINVTTMQIAQIPLDRTIVLVILDLYANVSYIRCSYYILVANS